MVMTEPSNAELAGQLIQMAESLVDKNAGVTPLIGGIRFADTLRLAAQRLEAPITDAMVERTMLILYRREVTTERVRAALSAALERDEG